MIWDIDPHGLDPIDGSEWNGSGWTPDMMPGWEAKMKEYKEKQRLARQRLASSGKKTNLNLDSEEEWPSL